MDTHAVLSDNEALGFLKRAAYAMAVVLEMVQTALEGADRKQADATYVARLREEYKYVPSPSAGDKPKPPTLHPLFPLWRMAAQVTRGLERILSLTNPQLVAERQFAKLQAKRALKQQTAPVTA